MESESYCFKYFFIYGAVLMFVNTLASEHSINVTSGNQAVHNNYSPDTTISVNLVNLVEVSTFISTKIKTLFYDCKKAIIDQDYNNMYMLFKDWLWENRYKIGMYSISSFYGILSSYLLLEYHFYIVNGHLWSRWKSDFTLEQLYVIEQQALARELILSIQMINIDPKNPTSFAQPLISFIYTIDSEINRIKNYVMIAQKVYYAPCGIIFPTSEKKIAYARLLLERAQFIRHVFLSWLAEYNFIHNG